MEYSSLVALNYDKQRVQQTRRQKFSEGGLFDTAGGFRGRSRLPEALGYLVQNPAI